MAHIFFVNEDDVTITANGGIYRTAIINFFVPGFHGIDVNAVWLQQDGVHTHVSCHNRFIESNV